MPNVTKPYGDFTNNVDVVDAVKINAQYNTLYQGINGNLDSTNVPTIGDLTTLLTTAKNTLVAAMNEINTKYPYNALTRQAIINANLAIVNEGTSFTIATGTSRYVVEMFKAANNGSGVNATASQVALTDLPGSSFGMQIVHAGVPTTQGQLMQFHTLEAPVTADMAGQQRTLSVKVKGVAGMDRATLKVRYRTTNAAITDADTLVQAGVATAITAGGYTILTLTYTVPSKATLGANGVIGFQVVGSKTTAEANGDGFITAAWGDNAGDTALPFQGKSFPEELRATQLYYETGLLDGTGVVSSSGQLYGNRICFSVPKRVAPTVSASGSINGGISGAVTGVAAVTTQGFTPVANFATTDAGKAGVMFNSSWTADARL
jgi:hypothetical protein